MRHRKASVKFNRTSSHKEAMFRNMVTSLFKYDRIRTTDAKAKELSRWADHLITLAKKGDLHSRRQALSIVREKQVVHQLFEQVGERYGERAGGYTRIVKVGRRPGDSATVSIIELIGRPEKETKKPKKKKAAPAKKEAAVKTDAQPKETAEEKEKKKEVKPKKEAAPEKKTAKKKAAPKKKTAAKKEKAEKTGKDKGAKAAPKKKAVKAKKKAAPKKSAKKTTKKKEK